MFQSHPRTTCRFVSTKIIGGMFFYFERETPVCGVSRPPKHTYIHDRTRSLTHLVTHSSTSSICNRHRQSDTDKKRCSKTSGAAPLYRRLLRNPGKEPPYGSFVWAATLRTLLIARNANVRDRAKSLLRLVSFLHARDLLASPSTRYG